MSIEVSVLCTTYNHEKYIAQALESFVMQKTNFPFEVIVFDDASTDRTAEIIRSYEERYPDIIKPIYQKENLYSRRLSKLPQYEEKAQGRYIAFCEGDDFWCSPDKLQKQYDYMEQHLECSWCIHNAITTNAEGQKHGTITITDTDAIIPTEDVISGGGNFCATNSIFTHRELWFNRPDYFDIISLDYVMQIYLASQGTTFCFAEAMSAYRQGVAGSWTVRMNTGKGVAHRRVAHANKLIAMIKSYDVHTQYRYHDTISKDVVYMELCNRCFEKAPVHSILRDILKNRNNLSVKQVAKMLYYRFITN